MADVCSFDNHGVVSVMEFMDQALPVLRDEFGRRHAVLLQIRAFRSEFDDTATGEPGDGSHAVEEVATGNGLATRLCGPSLALLNVRASTQGWGNAGEVQR